MKLKLLAFATLLSSASVFAAGPFWGSRSPASGGASTTHADSFLVGSHTRGLTISGIAAGQTATTVGLAFFLSDVDSLRFDTGFTLQKPTVGTVNFGFDCDFGYRTYRFSSGNLKGFTQ